MLFLFLETMNPFQVLSWPASQDVAASYLKIITGPIPSEATLSPDGWALLVLVQEGE